MKPPKPPKKRCGAKAHHGGRCANWGKANGRCRYHGGNHGKPWNTGIKRPPEQIRPMREAVARLQASRKAMGLPWFGPKQAPKFPPQEIRDTVGARMADAVEIADRAIAVLESGESEAALLQESIGAALALNRDTIKLAQAALDRDKENVDQKLLRLGNEVATAICRLGMRVAETQFRQKKDDVLVRLLESLAKEDARAK
jgi:hypothetical protein